MLLYISYLYSALFLCFHFPKKIAVKEDSSTPLCHSHKTIPIAHPRCGLLQIYGIRTVSYFGFQVIPLIIASSFESLWQLLFFMVCSIYRWPCLHIYSASSWWWSKRIWARKRALDACSHCTFKEMIQHYDLSLNALSQNFLKTKKVFI